MSVPVDVLAAARRLGVAAGAAGQQGQPNPWPTTPADIVQRPITWQLSRAWVDGYLAGARIARPAGWQD